MLYILEVKVEIPERIKKDGEYLSWLRDEFGNDEWHNMSKEIKAVRSNHTEYFNRIFEGNICTNEYVTSSVQSRDTAKATIQKYMPSDKFIITYVEKEFNGTTRDYVFLQ